MKRIILTIAALLMLSIPAFAQAPEDWERMPEIEEYFSLFEVEVEVWYNPIDMVLSFEDDYSLDFDDMLFQWGYLMTALEFMLEDSGQIFEDVNIDVMIYSFFVVVDSRFSKYEEPNMRYDLHMERNWSIDYFNLSRRERQEMLYDLFDDHYREWFPQKRAY